MIQGHVTSYLLFPHSQYSPKEKQRNTKEEKGRDQEQQTFSNTPRKDKRDKPLGLEIRAFEISTAVTTVNYLKFIEALIGAMGEELFQVEIHQLLLQNATMV